MTEFTLAAVSELIAASNANVIHPLIMDGREVYLMTISPKMRATLVMIKAKSRWKERYRDDRIARRAATS
jgi:hypothetical protein